jgi:hypothetical protein
VDAGEAFAEAASGMEFGEVFGLPASAAAYFEGKGVAEGEHYCGGGGGSEVQWAGFGVYSGVEDDVAGLREGGGCAAAEGDELVGQPLEDGKEIEDLFGLAAGREGEDGVAAGEHSEIAVDGVGRVQVVSWCAGGAEGGRDLAGDDAALADAGDDDAVLAGDTAEDEVGGGVEGGEHWAFKAEGEGVEGGGFDADEVGGLDGFGRDGGFVGHDCLAMSMLAERFVVLDRSGWVYV